MFYIQGGHSYNASENKPQKSTALALEEKTKITDMDRNEDHIVGHAQLFLERLLFKHIGSELKTHV